MHSTTLTASTPCARRQHRAIRRGTTAAIFAAALAASVSATAHGAEPAVAARWGGCTVTPTANSMPFDVSALVTTVRQSHGVIEMLHDAVCIDGRVGTVWLVADFT